MKRIAMAALLLGVNLPALDLSKHAGEL